MATEVNESNRSLAEQSAVLIENNKASMTKIQCLEKKNERLQDSTDMLSMDKIFLSKVIDNHKARIQELEASNMNINERFRQLDLAEQEALLKQIDREKTLQDSKIVQMILRSVNLGSNYL